MKPEEFEKEKDRVKKLLKGIFIVIIGTYFLLLQPAMQIDCWVKTRNNEHMLVELYKRAASGGFTFCPEPVNPDTGVIYKDYKKVFEMMLKGYQL